MEESNGNNNTIHEPTLTEWANKLRGQIKDIARETKYFSDRIKISVQWSIPQNTLDIEGNKEEMIANAVLAYRHLEEASIHLNKAIQAYDGGVSVYDKETTVGA